MTSRHLCALFLDLALAWAGAVAAAELPAAETSATADAAQAATEAAALVPKLADPQYAVRRATAERLTALGLPARNALLGGMKHSDAEVRRQCRWILDGVFEIDYQNRLRAFEADAKDERDHQIPGWDRYKKTVGSDAKARALFLQMQKAEGGLLESAAAGAAAASDAVNLRLRQVMQAMSGTSGVRRAAQQPSLGTAAAILFIISDPQVTLPQNVAESYYLFNIIQQGECARELQENKNPAMKRIVGLWMLRPTSVNMLHNKLNFALQYEIREGVDLALRALKDPQAAPPHYRSMALTVIGQVGGKDYAAAFQDLLKDKSDLFRGVANGKQTTCQLRDVALAWLLYLTEQDHAAYGMERSKQDFENMRKNRRMQLNYVNAGFPDEASREAALKKWDEYVAAHPLKSMPVPTAVEIVPVTPQLAAPQVVKGGNEPAPDFAPGMKLQLADRLQVQSLNMARQLCDEGRYGEGVRLLDAILAAGEDFAYQAAPRTPLFRCLKAEAERLIGELPDEGRAAYRLQFEALSRTLLDEAIRSGGIRGVADVAERFFHTEAGCEAAYLLANYYFDRGQVFRAALHYERLRNGSREAARLEPALSLKLATCFMRSGMVREAEDALRRLPAKQGKKPVAVGGQDRELFTQTAEAVRWLEALVGPAERREAAEGWTMYRGEATRNAVRNVGSPALAGAALATTVSPDAIRQRLAKVRKEFLDQYRPALPRLHPLVVGAAVVYRTATHLQAVDLASGKLLWEAGLEDSLRHFLRTSGDGWDTENVNRGLRQRLWDDLTFGTLSSDGRAVYGVEDVSFGFGAEYQRMAVGPDGQRRLDAESLRKHNLLTAHDLQTGKLMWEIGGAPGEDMRPVAGALFLGPPLPLGNRLYACAEIDNETRLLEIESETGQLVSSLTLALRDTQTAAEQQAMFFPIPVTQTPPNARRTGASPSYASGILVCQIGENQFCGINLATRAVRWVYQMPEPETGRRNVFNPFGVRARQDQAALDSGDRWADGSVTIAEGRVLITPADSNELICLSLGDGRLEWSAPRRDGLYLGGVHDGRVLVVGRSNVWTLDMQHGKPAWQHDRTPLPAGALPSGYGLLAQGRYHLPLSSGEVATLELAEGRFVCRSRSSDGVVPGNLVACRDTVVSQNAEGIWRFETLAARDASLAAALARSPADGPLLRQRGEVLLSNGRPGEAVEHLRKALALKPDEKTRQLLAEAVLDGLRADFDRFAPLAERLDPVLKRAERRGDCLRQLAVGLQQAGRRLPAFEAYLKLVGASAAGDELERIETARLVRRDCWAAARLAELWAGADEPQRQRMDQLVTAELNGSDRRQAMLHFGWHPAAMDLRLRLAATAAAQQQRLDAEWFLRQVWQGGNAAQQREAGARTARLLADASWADASARWHTLLARDYADEPCLDGQTGRQLAAALAADSPVRKALERPLRWPQGKAKIESSDAQPTNLNSQRCSVPVSGDGGPLGDVFTCEAEVQQKRLVGYDTLGRTRWTLPLADDQNWSFFNYHFNYARVWTRGRLVVAWLGNRIYAFDAFAQPARLLWKQEAFKTVPPQFPGIPMRMRGGMQPPPLPAADALPLVVVPGCVAFIQDRNLLALEPLSGKPLWRRDDMTFDSTLFGDDEMLLVTPPDATEAVVYRVGDGHELGRRAIAPEQQRLWTIGRRVAVWRAVGDRIELALTDPWTQQTLWRHEFDSKAQPALVGGDEVAVLDSQGRFVVIDLLSGRQTLAREIEPLPGLERIYVQRSSQRQYLLATARPTTQNAMIIFNPMQQQLRISGRLYAFEPAHDGPRWMLEVENQGLRLDQPADVPVLTLFNQVHEIENNRGVRNYLKLLCVDRRNGKLLYERESKDGRPNLCDVQVDVEKWQVEVRSYIGCVKVTFAEQKTD